MADQLMLGLDIPGAHMLEGRGRRGWTSADEIAREMAENAYLATWCDKMALRLPHQRERWLKRAEDYRLLVKNMTRRAG